MDLQCLQSLLVLYYTNRSRTANALDHPIPSGGTQFLFALLYLEYRYRLESQTRGQKKHIPNRALSAGLQPEEEPS